MDLILTHENADFDAVAAQLAMHRLTPDAVPVLPLRQNRNVQHFMECYGSELPFVLLKDLKRPKVSRVFLVDTQHVQTMRGMSRRTPVLVTDHHAITQPVRPNWELTVDQVGATTTILVERLVAQQTALTSIEATLLALGIYEDTGSLSYSATTPRDLYAAGWLLAHGAQLDLVREFLQHPLSAGQFELYNLLLAHTQTYPLAGETIIIATAAAPEPVEEIATLAHRLRDLLNPSAIFLLVDMGTHIQMVARSSTNAVDVGLIAAHWGGGGHSRAAAAILKDSSLESARANLLDLLKTDMHPPVTVGDLMSHGVRTLSPGVKVGEADARMRRYGYEGFPVVKRGHIVGLLTRRAVDRAMDHKMNAVPVERVMEAGDISVLPSDTLATVQQVMRTSGWGQIPVVDEDGVVRGVITRTDVIKNLGRIARAERRRDEIASLFSHALPPVLLALSREAGRVADSLGFRLYVVGGVVRDLLLGYPVEDLDFVVEGDAIQLTHALSGVFGGAARAHERFGTGKWILSSADWGRIAEMLGQSIASSVGLPTSIDFVSARTEYYAAPSELPEVEMSSIKHDLHRRDFTINTLAIRLDPARFGEMLDFYGGEADLEDRRIRILHSLSFVDDPTRIVRAVRLEQRLKFHLDPRTEDLIGHALPLLARVSADRVRHEIEAVLQEAVPEDSVRRLDELDVCTTLHSGWQWHAHMADGFRRLRGALAAPLWPELRGLDLAVPYFALWTLSLTIDSTTALCKRLHVRRRTSLIVERFHALAGGLTRLSRRCRPSAIDDLLHGSDDRVLIALWAVSTSQIARSQILDYATRIRHIAPATNGHKLHELGVQPGAAMGRILRALRIARLDGSVETDEQETVLLHKLVADESAKVVEIS